MENKNSMICKSCGQKIGDVIVHRFTWEGGDDESVEKILGGEDGSCYYLDIDMKATMFEFEDCFEEFISNIWCPLCKKYPFGGSVSIYKRAHVVFGVSEKSEFE